MTSLQSIIADTELGRGYIEHIVHYDGKLEVAGWLLLPGHEFDHFDVYLDGTLKAQVEATYDEAIHKAIGPDRDYFPARFFASFPTDIEPLLSGWHPLHVIATRNSEPVARIETLHRELLANRVPSPPEHLRFRVTRGQSLKFFKESGARSIAYFMNALKAHGLPLKRERVLDWGCGCGRLTELARVAFETDEVYGCDIDAEAIHFCTENIEGGNYQVIPPHPPTSCSDQFFDTVLGYSVCTHLTEEVQMAWIKELRRVTKPGAIVMLSVHGPFAFSFDCPQKNSGQILAKRGIIADHIDDILEDQAPESYYRTTYQDPEWTKKNWGQHFEVLGYHERGMVNLHDLVVLRRPR